MANPEKVKSNEVMKSVKAAKNRIADYILKKIQHGTPIEQLTPELLSENSPSDDIKKKIDDTLNELSTKRGELIEIEEPEGIIWLGGYEMQMSILSLESENILSPIDIRNLELSKLYADREKMQNDLRKLNLRIETMEQSPIN